MTKAAIALAIPLVLSAFFRCAAEEKDTLTISLKAIQNGRPVRTPREVRMRFCATSTTASVVNGRFLVPKDALGCPTISLDLKIGRHVVRPSGIPTNKLRDEYWTVLIADRSYGRQYDWFIPAGTSVGSTCIVSFESKEAEGTFLLDERCRVGKVAKATRTGR